MSLIKKQSANAALPVRQQRLQVSPYENPEVTLELVGKITSAQPQSDAKLFWEAYNHTWNNTLTDLPEFESLEENGEFVNSSFVQDVNRYTQHIANFLAVHHESPHTQIVLAGGFSSGKSSFLNQLINQKGLLPTGTKPVSVVKTYLYCDKGTQQLTVQGVNKQGVLVTLDSSVLQAIQHANTSHVHLASVLDKLLVHIPSPELDGLAFIDTPGYNNSDRANASNQKTDQETALEAFDEGQVLFWLIDAEKGTTVKEDLEIIAQFKDRKKVIIFNKADKKGEAACRKIVEDAYKVVEKHLNMDEVVDIMAYSSVDNRIYYSLRKYKSIQTLLQAMREAPQVPLYALAKEYVELSFDREIEATQEQIEEWDKEFLEASQEKRKAVEQLQEEKKSVLKLKVNIEQLLTSYTNNVQAVSKLYDLFYATYDWSYKVSNEIINSNNSKFNTHDDINNKCDRLQSALDRRFADYQAVNTEYYPNYMDGKNGWFKEWLYEKLDKALYDYKSAHEKAKERTASLKERMANEQKFLVFLQRYKRRFVSAIKAGIDNYLKHRKPTQVSVQAQHVDVFSAIERRDYKAFLRSFEQGVELSHTNSAGFTPLTYAAHFGNMAMVQFLIEHEADCAGVDKRGYNALHTALQVGAKGICELLLDRHPSLKQVPAAPKGQPQSIQDLIAQRDFQAWAEQTFSL